MERKRQEMCKSVDGVTMIEKSKRERERERERQRVKETELR